MRAVLATDNAAILDIEPEIQDKKNALKVFSALENIRLDACIKRELPGLHRDMQNLKNKQPALLAFLFSENSLSKQAAIRLTTYPLF